MQRNPEGATARLALVVESLDVAGRWEQDALCRGVDGGLFFGPHGFEPKRERAEREEAAKAICAGCPALGPCREYALGQGEMYGVWGGLGEAERRSLLARGDRVARAG